MLYVPMPYQGQGIERYIDEELVRIQETLAALADGQMPVRTVAPDKPRNGLYYADGTNWNPGSGRGVYRFDETGATWHFLG